MNVGRFIEEAIFIIKFVGFFIGLGVLIAAGIEIDRLAHTPLW